MNTATAKSFLTILSSRVRVERERLYQLVRAAEHSYSLKDTKQQAKIGGILRQCSHPFDQVGKYFEAMHLIRSKNFSDARNLLEQVAEHAPDRYRTKALLAIGGVEEIRGNIEEAWKFRIQGLRASDPLVVMEAHMGIAVLKSLEGSHHRAVEHIENFLPLARLLRGTPRSFDYLNSYAVELGDSGRLEEAKQVINIVLASPYVSHYPNWVETGKDIYSKLRPASHPIISFKWIENNLLILPTSESPVVESPPAQPAKVFSLAEWKEKMVKEQNNEPDENVDELEKSDLIVRLLELTTKDDMNEEKLRKILKYSYKVMTGK
jgi:tetratricopeptide (TPR) repeat protein